MGVSACLGELFPVKGNFDVGLYTDTLKTFLVHIEVGKGGNVAIDGSFVLDTYIAGVVEREFLDARQTAETAVSTSADKFSVRYQLYCGRSYFSHADGMHVGKYDDRNVVDDFVLCVQRSVDLRCQG